MFRTIRISDPRFEANGLRHIIVKSAALKGRGEITVYHPTITENTKDLPIVILLHGVYGSHLSWSIGAGAHLTAQRLIEEGKIPPMILAMPSDGLWGDGTGYIKHESQDFEKWIVDEVPAALLETLDTVSVNSKIFIGGLSMGGFGALRLGAKYAKRFSGISAHSSITHLDQMAQFVEEDFSKIEIHAEEKSVLHFFKKNRFELPPTRFDCGKEDILIEANRALHHALQIEGIGHLYEEFEGKHEWSYWETHLVDSLLFFSDILRNS